MSAKKQKNRNDFKNQILQRKNDEIESLKTEILKLQSDCEEKDELINSIEPLRSELKKVIEDLKVKREEYDNLNNDLRQMRQALNHEVFKDRWWLVKLLMK